MNQLWKELLRETSILTQYELLDIISKYKSTFSEDSTFESICTTRVSFGDRITGLCKEHETQIYDLLTSLTAMISQGTSERLSKAMKRIPIALCRLSDDSSSDSSSVLNELNEQKVDKHERAVLLGIVSCTVTTPDLTEEEMELLKERVADLEGMSDPITWILDESSELLQKKKQFNAKYKTRRTVNIKRLKRKWWGEIELYDKLKLYIKSMLRELYSCWGNLIHVINLKEKVDESDKFIITVAFNKENHCKFGFGDYRGAIPIGFALAHCVENSQFASDVCDLHYLYTLSISDEVVIDYLQIDNNPKYLLRYALDNGYLEIK